MSYFSVFSVDLFQITELTSTTPRTIQYLRQNGLLKQEHTCCGVTCNLIKHHSSDEEIFRCGKCRKKHSIRSDSFFFRSNLPLKVIVFVIYLWTVGSSIGETLKHLKGHITDKPLSDWFSFIRDICTYCNNRLRKFNGICEVDESFVGCIKKYGRGVSGQIRGHNKGPTVFGIIERITKYIKLFYVADTKATTLIPIILNHVEVNSTINSDGARCYSSLGNNFTHNVVIHQDEFVAADGTHTNNIENVWSHMKNKHRQMHGARETMRKQYLDEFVFRWNNRQRGVNDWDAILEGIKTEYPL